MFGLKWVMIQNGKVTEPAVAFPGTMLFSFPISIVQKRVQNNEDVDAFYLFVGLIEVLATKFRTGDYDTG